MLGSYGALDMRKRRRKEVLWPAPPGLVPSSLHVNVPWCGLDLQCRHCLHSSAIVGPDVCDWRRPRKRQRNITAEMQEAGLEVNDSSRGSYEGYPLCTIAAVNL